MKVHKVGSVGSVNLLQYKTIIFSENAGMLFVKGRIKILVVLHPIRNGLVQMDYIEYRLYFQSRYRTHHAVFV